MTKGSLALLGACMLAASCDSPTAFAPQLTPPQVGGPGQQYRLSGQVLSLQGRQPVAGATGQWLGFTTSPLTTDAAGRFSIDVSAGSLMFTMNAPGYLERGSTFLVSASRDNVLVDMISLEPPFALDFYRQFVRNSLERPAGYSHTHPWPYDPKFYIRTITDDSGEVVPDAVIEGVRRVIEASVRELSGGRLKAAEILSGPDEMATAVGLVHVSFMREVGPDRVGEATVGFSLGRRYTHLKYYGDPALSNPRRCEDAAVRIAEHEMAHIMGFFHTSETSLDFQSAGDGCPGAGRSARALYHANIMYSRPAGNLDPDRDPPGYATPAALREATVIRCNLR